MNILIGAKQQCYYVFLLIRGEVKGSRLRYAVQNSGVPPYLLASHPP